MKIDDIAKQLANKVNQEHYIKHYLEKVQRGAYNKGIKDAEAKQLNLCGVGCSLPTKKAVSSYLKHYTKQEMTEFKQDELICFTSGALTLHTWLSEGKIK